MPINLFIVNPMIPLDSKKKINLNIFQVAVNANKDIIYLILLLVFHAQMDAKLALHLITALLVNQNTL